MSFKYYKRGFDLALNTKYVVIDEDAFSMWEFYDLMAGIRAVSHINSLPDWWLH